VERDKIRLIQQDYLDDPWKMLVSCICLNRTSNYQVKKILPEIFENYPTHVDMSQWQEKSVEGKRPLPQIIKPLGFMNRRSSILKRFSEDWGNLLKKCRYVDWWDLKQLTGMGKYAIDSYRIFIEDYHHVNPTDLKLNTYISENVNESTERKIWEVPKDYPQ